jgi:hypothetical protein
MPSENVRYQHPQCELKMMPLGSPEFRHHIRDLASHPVPVGPVFEYGIRFAGICFLQELKDHLVCKLPANPAVPAYPRADSHSAHIAASCKLGIQPRKRETREGERERD